MCQGQTVCVHWTWVPTVGPGMTRWPCLRRVPAAAHAPAHVPAHVPAHAPAQVPAPAPSLEPDAKGEWGVDYAQSAFWGADWRATQDPLGVWPEGVRLQGGHMLFEGRICVPENRSMEVIAEFHETLGHIGVNKSVKELNRRFYFPDSLRLWEATREVRRKCVTCQVCEPPNWSTSLPISPTPVPDQIMTSVSLDVFALPQVQWDGKKFDSLLVCVDRLSGWILARPCTKLGLTAEKAAHLILDNGWETFGVPSVITSDQGSQFVGQWWKTMCARLGIRQAYSQAYRPQANGKAEVAGKTIINLLRKLHTDNHINWVEALPRVLRLYHDTPGESKISPFQMLFGRERNLAGVPYTIPRECEGAEAFFTRMEGIEREAAAYLNKIHRRESDRVNSQRSDGVVYAEGDWVWVLRPRNSGVSKLDTWWVGPTQIVKRVGERSYQVRVKPSVVQDVHVSDMKPFVGDRVSGSCVELFHHMTGYQAMGVDPDEWVVSKIVSHRVSGGELQFLTQWEGHPGEDTWEPARNFVARYCSEFVHYIRDRRVTVDMGKVLTPQN